MTTLLNTAPRVDTDALKRAHAIEDVVASYGIALRPSGRAYVGRCPFHDDRRRGNLHVYPATGDAPGHYYCYRCGASGDAIRFVQDLEHLDFRAACERLGHRPRTEARLPALSRQAAPRRWDRLTLDEQEVLNAAIERYQWALWRDARALAHVRGRGIPDAVLRACRVGYAEARAGIAANERGDRLATAEALGLVRRTADGRLREVFAGRIVVPEVRGGNATWLIGRALPGVPTQRRYLALPGERPVLGLERATGPREVFLCEGVFDWLTAVAWELPACSPCGTALPPERLGFLAPASRVYGVFDGDAGGAAASARFAALLGRRWCPLRLPDGHDLNDLGRAPDGRARFERLLADARAATPTPEEIPHAG